MGKITPSIYFDSLSGKIGKKGNKGVQLHKKTGKMYAVVFNEDAKQPNTTLQQGVKTKFKTKSQAASTWWAANKPIVAANGTVTREGTADYKKVKAAFDATNKYNNIYVFLRSLVNDDGTITLPGGTTTSGGTTNTPSDNREEL